MGCAGTGTEAEQRTRFALWSSVSVRWLFSQPQLCCPPRALCTAAVTGGYHLPHQHLRHCAPCALRRGARPSLRQLLLLPSPAPLLASCSSPPLLCDVVQRRGAEHSPRLRHQRLRVPQLQLHPHHQTSHPPYPSLLPPPPPGPSPLPSPPRSQAQGGGAAAQLRPAAHSQGGQRGGGGSEGQRDARGAAGETGQGGGGRGGCEGRGWRRRGGG